MVVKARNEKDEQTSFFADPYSKPVVRGKDHTPFDDFVWFAIRGYQKEFHLANLTLFLTEFGLYKFAQTPSQLRRSVRTCDRARCLYTSVTKPMPDEVDSSLFAGLRVYGILCQFTMASLFVRFDLLGMVPRRKIWKDDVVQRFALRRTLGKRKQGWPSQRVLAKTTRRVRLFHSWLYEW